MMKETNPHSRRERLLLQASRMLNSTVEYEDLIRVSLQLVCQALACEAAFAFRLDEKLDHRRVRLYHVDRQELLVLHKTSGAGVSGRAISEEAPQVVNGLSAEDQAEEEIVEQVDFAIRNLIAIPLISRGKVFGALEALNCLEGDFNDIDRDTLLGLSAQIAISMDNSQLLRSARRQARERQELFEVSTRLSGELNLNDALKMILKSVRDLVGFDAAGIFLVDHQRGEFGGIYSEGYDSEREPELHLKLDRGLIGWVVDNKECVVVPDVTNDDRYVSAREQTRSEMVAPVMAGGEVVAVFNLECDEVGAYDGHSGELLQAFGAQAAAVIERTMLHARIVHSKALEKQLEIAHQIQQGFLPRVDPQIPGYEISGMNTPSGEVGGDYYDHIDVVEGMTGLAIADVSGKGVPAGLIMAAFRASLLAEIRNNFSVREICHKVNSLVAESVETGNYVTGVYGVLDSQKHLLTYCNAGHNPPLVAHRDGSISELSLGGTPFGIIADASFEEGTLEIQEGDVILFFTDGVTEAQDMTEEQFGEKRLQELLQSILELPAAEICRRIYAAVNDWAPVDVPQDDITLMVVKRL